MKKPIDMEIEQAVRIDEAINATARQTNIKRAWGALYGIEQERLINAVRAANRVRDKHEKKGKRK